VLFPALSWRENQIEPESHLVTLKTTEWDSG